MTIIILICVNCVGKLIIIIVVVVVTTVVITTPPLCTFPRAAELAFHLRECTGVATRTFLINDESQQKHFKKHAAKTTQQG